MRRERKREKEREREREREERERERQRAEKRLVEKSGKLAGLRYSAASITLT